MAYKELRKEVERAVDLLADEFEENLFAVNGEAPMFAYLCAPCSGYFQIMLGREVIWDSENDDTWDNDDDLPVIYERCKSRLLEMARTFAVFAADLQYTSVKEQGSSVREQ